MKEKIKDLSKYHHLLHDFFEQPSSKADWEQYRLSEEQVNFFHENGYISDIKLLEEWQVDALNQELTAIADPEHPAHHLFYEFHSNESNDPNAILFHALVAWRITEGFHDVLWNPAIVMAVNHY